jgi:hypothetical protein
MQVIAVYDCDGELEQLRCFVRSRADYHLVMKIISKAIPIFELKEQESSKDSAA